MVVTIITMYRGHDAETFVQVVEGELTDKQKTKWRKAHNCDEFCDDEFDENNMFFQTAHVRKDQKPTDLLYADGC